LLSRGGEDHETFHDRRGFTLIELMIVVAIIGICAAIAMPAMTSYKRKEDTRQAAVSVSGMLTNARARAIASGRMTFVLLGEPGDGSVPFAAGQIAAMVMDDNGDNAVTAADTAVAIFPVPGMNPEISYYGISSTPHRACFPRRPLQSEPDVALGAVADGRRCRLGVLGVPVVAFAAGRRGRGRHAGGVGHGAGGIYITDNSDSVVAVLVLPLGSVKMQKYDTASGEWK
jgi:prepilin-type N-terminal cleavage/methylation domain-containing protein